MYKINYRNFRKQQLFSLSFIVVGLIVFMTFSLVLIGPHIKKSSLDSEAVGFNIVKDCGTSRNSCSSRYVFEYDNKYFYCTVNLTSNTFVHTNTTTVYFDSINPNRCLTEHLVSIPFWNYLFLLIPLSFFLIGLFMFGKTTKKISQIKKLSKKGKLIRNLEYCMENSSVTVNKVPLKRIALDYRLPNGDLVTLTGEPRFDRKSADADNLVDLLIDPNDPTNYYIDFNIDQDLDF